MGGEKELDVEGIRMRGRKGWIALGLLVAAPVMAQAQQGGNSGNRLMFDPNGVQTTGQGGAREAAPAKPSTPAAPAAKKPAKPETKPAAAARRPSSATDDRTAAGSARLNERPIPREQPTALGRLSIPGGTLGYESETSMKAYDLSDGRRVPGYENIQRQDSSYFGLSVRMPTSPSPFRSHGAE